MSVELVPTPDHTCAGDSARRFGCPACAALPPHPDRFPVMMRPQTQAVIAAKTPGLAVLLTFLWLGAGHLYANKTGVGIALISLEACLLLLALTGFGLFIAVPVWAVATPITMIFAARAAGSYNRRHGIDVR